MSYDNTNKGTLGRNKRKEKDTHPDFAGSINIEGVEYWLSGWIKEGPTGKFFSLAAKPKVDRPKQEPPDPVSQPPDAADDNIPF